MWYTNIYSNIKVYQKYQVTSIKEDCATCSLYASSGPKAKGIQTNNKRGRGSGPWRLWGGLDKARHIVQTFHIVIESQHYFFGHLKRQDHNHIICCLMSCHCIDIYKDMFINDILFLIQLLNWRSLVEVYFGWLIPVPFLLHSFCGKWKGWVLGKRFHSTSLHWPFLVGPVC